MKSFHNILLLSCFLLLAASPLCGQTVRIESFQGREVAAGEIIVKFSESVSEQIRSTAVQDADIELTEPVGRSGTMRIRSRGRNTAALLQDYAARADVLYAQPNYLYYASVIPTDPSFPKQYGLNNTGQSVNGQSGIAGADIKAAQAWDITQGSQSIVVGVVDTGIDYTHPDLIANLWSAPTAFSVTIAGKKISCAAGSHGFNAIARSCDPLDSNGHGTHISGIIGATGNNGIGVSGVSPVVTILPLLFLSPNGSGTDADAIAAIDFAIQVRSLFGSAANIRVLNNSWGGSNFSQALLDEINLANANDMLFVVAAGNDSANIDAVPDYPASYNAPNIITVSATDNRDALAPFSNYGTSRVHIAAPGVSIFSTLLNSGYDYLSGTSMAAPMVSGAAALVLSACSLSTPGLKADLLGSVDPLSALIGKTSTAGRLNVSRALTNCVGAPFVNFTLTASPGVQSVPLGGSSNISVSVVPVQGFAGTVSLSISNLPAGMTASFSPSAIAGGAGSSTLTLTANSNLAGGTYIVNISGTSGSLTHTVGIAIISNSTISLHQTISGVLSANSPASTHIPGAYANLYTLQIAASTSVTIELHSADFTSALYLLSSTGSILRSSSSSFGASFTTTLAAGIYVIEAAASPAGSTGEFNLSVNSPILDGLNPNFGFPGSVICVQPAGTGLGPFLSLDSDSSDVRVSASNTGCSWTFTVSGSAVPGQTNVRAVTGSGVSNATPFTIYPVPPSIGLIQTVSGTLSAFDQHSNYKKGRFADFYKFTVPAVGNFHISLQSPNFDTYLFTFSSAIDYLGSNDNFGTTTNSELNYPYYPGTNYIEVSSAFPGATGAYTLSIAPVPNLFHVVGNTGPQGGSGIMTLSGNYLSSSMTVSAVGVNFGPVTMTDASTASIPFTVDSNAALGARGFTVTSNGATSDPIFNFTVSTATVQLSDMSPVQGFPGTSFTATFIGNYFVAPLTVNVAGGVSASNVQIFSPNLAVATLTIANNAAAGSRSVTLTNSAGTSVKAVNFTVNPPALTVSKSGTGSGTITSSPAGIDCGGTCDTTFVPGQVYALTAIPAAGSIFAGWSGDPDCIDGTVTMAAARNCVARFDLPPSNTTLLRGDYDGDGKTDIAVYRPSTGEWYFRLSSQNFVIAQGNWYFQWGVPGDVPLSGDFDGDGRSDIAVYRLSTGEWYFRLSTQGYNIAQGNWYFQWGVPGDVPIASDFDGDGKSDIAVYRPSTGEWYIRLSTQGYNIAQGNWYFQWGVPDDQPLAVDFDGDGKADIAVYRPSTGEWLLRYSTKNYVIGVGTWIYQWGAAGDIAVPGDFDGDKKTDIAVYRPSTGEWFLRLSKLNYAPGSGNWYFIWGVPGDLPIKGDFDGDLKADIAIYRPLTGEWYIRLSTLNYVVAQGNWYFQWGGPGDVPFRR